MAFTIDFFSTKNTVSLKHGKRKGWFGVITLFCMSSKDLA